MATAFSTFRAPIICSAALPEPRKPDPSRRSNNWWVPIFGWKSDPDYIGNLSPNRPEPCREIAHPDQARADKSAFVGCFTEEKAKELRKKTSESSAFHDVMYHLAIAARFASDVSGQHDER